MHTLVVLNSASGAAGRTEATAPLWDTVATRSDWELVEPDGADASRRLLNEALDAGCERVVVAGGDGTIHGVVQILAERDQPPLLALVPTGTGNDLARTLGVPRDPAAALQVIDQGRVRSLDLVRVEASSQLRHCINTATGGFSRAMGDAMSEEDKRMLGPLSYFKAAAERFGSLSTYDVRAEGSEIEPLALDEVVAVAVANGRYCAGGLPIAPEADPTDGELDLAIVRRGSALATAAAGARLAAGWTEGTDLLHTARARRLTITTRPAMGFHLDGEPFEPSTDGDGHARITFEVVPRALPVVVGPDFG